MSHNKWLHNRRGSSDGDISNSEAVVVIDAADKENATTPANNSNSSTTTMSYSYYDQVFRSTVNRNIYGNCCDDDDDDNDSVPRLSPPAPQKPPLRPAPIWDSNSSTSQIFFSISIRRKSASSSSRSSTSSSSSSTSPSSKVDKVKETKKTVVTSTDPLADLVSLKSALEDCLASNAKRQSSSDNKKKLSASYSKK